MCCTNWDYGSLRELSNNEPDMERLCFNGERERHRNERSRLLSVPPAASIYHHWSWSQAELMPTCCTQMADICIDACARGKGVECVFQWHFLLCSHSTTAEGWSSCLLLHVLTGKDGSGHNPLMKGDFYQASLLLRALIVSGLGWSLKIRIKIRFGIAKIKLRLVEV